MKALKPAELRDKTAADLRELLAKERSNLFQLKRKLAFKEEKDVRSAIVQRHNIARIITILAEKEKGK